MRLRDRATLLSLGWAGFFLLTGPLIWFPKARHIRRDDALYGPVLISFRFFDPSQLRNVIFYRVQCAVKCLVVGHDYFRREKRHEHNTPVDIGVIVAVKRTFIRGPVIPRKPTCNISACGEFGPEGMKVLEPEFSFIENVYVDPQGLEFRPKSSYKVTVGAGLLLPSNRGNMASHWNHHWNIAIRHGVGLRVSCGEESHCTGVVNFMDCKRPIVGNDKSLTEGIGGAV